MEEQTMMEKLMHSTKPSAYWMFVLVFLFLIPTLMGVMITVLFKGFAPGPAIICAVIYAIFLIRLICSNI
jgi:hypothetical protein